MVRWFFNLSIKYKIMLLFYVALGIFSTGFYIYGTHTAQKNLIEQVGSTNLVLLQQISSNISFMQREIEDMSTQLIIQPQIQDFIRPFSEGNNYTQKLYIDTNIRNAVNLIVSKDYITSLSIVGFSNNTIPFLRSIDKNFIIPPVEELYTTEFFQRVKSSEGRPVWTENTDEIAVFGASNHHNRVLMARIVREYNTYENLGILVIGIGDEALRNIYTDGIETDNCAIAILTSSGEIISHAGIDISAELGSKLLESLRSSQKGFMIMALAEEDMLLSHVSDTQGNRIYLYAVPMAPLTKQLAATRQFIVLMVAASLALVFPLMLFAGDLIIRPLYKLLDCMKTFQSGDFDALVSLRYRDEIGQLGAGYNEMVINIRDLVDRVYLLQIREREAELTALQAQINPHFLYNTLDSIYWRAQKSNQPEISEMVKLLSNMFRMSLNKGNRLSTAYYECKLVETYLQLQQLRRGARLEYEIHLSPEAESLSVPKLLIQPFVENAVTHGLEKKESLGRIDVTCEIADDDLLLFTIEDNGAGIDKATADALCDGSYHSEEQTGGYAVRNVLDRLELMYGDSFFFNITGGPDSGTKVVLKIPIIKEASE